MKSYTRVLTKELRKYKISHNIQVLQKRLKRANDQIAELEEAVARAEKKYLDWRCLLDECDKRTPPRTITK